MLIYSRDIMLPLVQRSRNTNIYFELEGEWPCSRKASVKAIPFPLAYYMLKDIPSSTPRHPEPPNRGVAKKIIETLAFIDVWFHSHNT